MICASCKAESDRGLACSCGAMLCGGCFASHVCGNAGGRPLWAHQEKLIADTGAVVASGKRAVVLCSPTGSGKTTVFVEIAKRAAAKGKRTLILTNRRTLLGQASDTLKGESLTHGLIISGSAPELSHQVQVASLQTIESWCFKRKMFDLPDADVVIVDEAHIQKSVMAQKVIRHYLEQGAVVIGPTATPVGLGGLYETIVYGPSKEELRKAGVLVPCLVFAPEDPAEGVKRLDCEFVYKDMFDLNEYGEPIEKTGSYIATEVFAYIFREWQKIQRRYFDGAGPTVVFAPGVKESRWIVQQFQAHGITAGHIDGSTPDEERRRLFTAFADGEVYVLSSCGVLREGVDLPMAVHGVNLLALEGAHTFHQVCGRLLRAFPGKRFAVLQCHAGSVWKHGSPNEDFPWTLDDTEAAVSGHSCYKKCRKCKERMEKGRPCAKCGWYPPESIRCPKCGGVRKQGPECPHCGHAHRQSVRMVRQRDGTLVEQRGPAVKKKKPPKSPEQKAWDSCLWALANAGGHKSCLQAKGWYRQKMGQDPPETLKNMPKSCEWELPVTEVFPWLKKRRKKVVA